MRGGGFGGTVSRKSCRAGGGRLRPSARPRVSHIASSQRFVPIDGLLEFAAAPAPSRSPSARSGATRRWACRGTASGPTRSRGTSRGRRSSGQEVAADRGRRPSSGSVPSRRSPWPGPQPCHNFVTDSADLSRPERVSHRLESRNRPGVTQTERPVNRRVVGSSPTRGASLQSQKPFR
jgi:hypothetical protein